MQTTLSIEIPKNKEIDQGVIDISNRAFCIVVKDNATMIEADTLLHDIKSMIKKIKDFFRPHKENAHKAWRSLCDAENNELERLENAVKRITPQVKSYLEKEEAKRKAEEDRVRLEALKIEEDNRLFEAAQLEAEGLKGEAEAVLETPAPIIMPTVEKTTPKADMRLYRKTWKFRITNELQIPREYLTPDLTKIGGVVRALKNKCVITGIQVYEE